MHFRYARHTRNLQPLIKFYTEVIGLETLGGFEDHANYNGIFLGHKNDEWHLEFTTSKEQADQHPDEDDLLVFYVETDAEINAILKTANKNTITPVRPKNPYWQQNGHILPDPDGFNVAISLKSPALIAPDPFTKTITATGINDWNALVNHIRQLPYGRNENRQDFSLVIKEAKGTCSSKHALLKQVADLNGIKNVELILCIYKMDQNNTPKIGNELTNHAIKYIPEAHCYLKLNNHRIDITSPNAEIEKIENDILLEIPIQPEQVVDYKIDFHKEYLKKWLRENDMKITFDEIWKIREQCIANLAG